MGEVLCQEDVNNPRKYKALFLYAPTAFGKTRLILKYYLQNNHHVVVLSPLKALEVEFNKRNSSYRKEGQILECFTAERFIGEFEKLRNYDLDNMLIFIDEIHLWNKWGNSFRPRLWEAFFLFASYGISFIGLTATMLQEYEKEWEKILKFGNYKLVISDLGNGRAAYYPSKTYNFFGHSPWVMRRRILYEAEKGGRILIFCRYRNEVKNLERRLLDEGLTCMTCLGGEGKEFFKTYDLKKSPQVIIATSVLSHGVNLGEISKVFMTYEVEDWDMHLQMMARAGRSGENYRLYHFNKKLNLIQWLTNLLFDRYLCFFYA